MLVSFAVVCFADLKKYKFTYHFGFPALHSNPPWKVKGLKNKPSEANKGKDEVWGARKLENDETSALVEAVQTWRYRVDARQHGFFLAKRVPQHKECSSGAGYEQRPETSGLVDSAQEVRWKIGSLADYEQDFFHDTKIDNQFICFADPSTYQSYPGWMLRNLLLLVRRRWKLQDVQILCYREIQSRRDEARSIIFNLQLDFAAKGTENLETIPKITGWERNNDGKVTSKVANLGEYMDPQR